MKFVWSCLMALPAATAIAVIDQQPLRDIDSSSGKTDLLYELKKAEIIPTIIDEFAPLLTLSIFWENATAEVGNTINPSRVQKAPDVQFIDHASSSSLQAGEGKASMQLTLALTDPDAPSRDNPEWSEICHWIATGVQLTQPSTSGFSKDVQEVMPYKPPGPPPKTGKHRYVFLALAPKNGTTEKLSLEKPGDRQHWGFGGEREGVRMWAERNGLVVVGANFIYAQNDEQ